MHPAYVIVQTIIDNDRAVKLATENRHVLLRQLMEALEAQGLQACRDCDPVRFRCGNVLVEWEGGLNFGFSVVTPLETVIEVEQLARIQQAAKDADDDLPY